MFVCVDDDEAAGNFVVAKTGDFMMIQNPSFQFTYLMISLF